MLKLAFYGKGGIGKSTTVCNLALALAEKGLQVMQIGCDPKADSTAALLNGRRAVTVLDLIRKYNDDFSWQDMVFTGEKNVHCVEAGGPVPGLGCAGRGIINALEKLESKGVYQALKIDVVLYDVLGDVVCGGFAMPMRSGYADKVYIISSGENMSIYAAANIAMAVKNFQQRNYARLGGFILNCRDVNDELNKVKTLAADFDSCITGILPRSSIVCEAEELNQAVLSAFPNSDMAQCYRNLADSILADNGVVLC
ncbi:MAG: nitrogenase iron protein [Lentisphaerae bacterium]|nr:nitrogenase iron protein [Lentisphaerota bacterium]